MILLLVSFIAGALTVLAPCVLPLLPVILAGSTVNTKNRRRPMIIIVSLSLSVFVFTLLLKGSTALIGASPTFWNYISAVILAVFGLTLIFPETWARIVLKIPGHNKPDRWITKGYDGTGNFWTDVIVGAALGPVFTTCSPTFFVILATVLPQSLSFGIDRSGGLHHRIGARLILGSMDRPTTGQSPRLGYRSQWLVQEDHGDHFHRLGYPHRLWFRQEDRSRHIGFRIL